VERLHGEKATSGNKVNGRADAEDLVASMLQLGESQLQPSYTDDMDQKSRRKDTKSKRRSKHSPMRQSKEAAQGAFGLMLSPMRTYPLDNKQRSRAAIAPGF